MTNEESLALYIIAFFLSAIFFSMANLLKKYKIISIICIIISSLIPILLSGLRYYVGTDYENYRVGFYKNLQKFNMDNIEIFHYIICNIAYKIDKNYQTMFLIYAILTIIFVYKAIWDENQENFSKFIAIIYYLFLYYVFTFNGVRQGLAIAIVFYAYKYLKNECLAKYLLFTIIATLVHISALIVIPLGIMYIYMKNNKDREKYIILIYLISCVFFLFISQYAASIPLINKILLYVGQNKTEISGTGIGLLVTRIPFFALIIIFYNKLKSNNCDIKLYIILAFLELIMSYLGFINISLNRFALYFSVYQIFLISNLAKFYKDRIVTCIIEICIIFFVLSQFIDLYYIKNISDIMPYSINEDYINERI